MGDRWPYGVPGEPDDDWYDDEPTVIDFDPEDPFSEKQMIVGKDPFMEEYLRSPYDPLYAAMAMGRMTGEVVRRPPKGGWMRVLAWVVAFVMITTGLVGSGLLGLLDAATIDDRWFRYEQFRSGLIAIPGVIAGALLLWRLLARRHD